MHRKYDLICFDLDGVLVDTCDYHKDAFNQALKEVTGSILTEEEHLTQFNGLPTREKLNKLLNQSRISVLQFDKIYNLKQKYTSEFIEKRLPIDQSKIDMLIKLKQNFYKTACFTNCMKSNSLFLLEKSLLLPLLDFVVSSSDISKPKPDPEGYNKILSTLKIPASRTLIVEDSDIGIQAAKSTGATIWETSFLNVNWENLSKWL